ncbi:MAG: hypothetical protein HY271_19385 [Deltaproteobacteria bacterium]|nr:hypothetical protein [Deltaproteobacteria bacterium]
MASRSIATRLAFEKRRLWHLRLLPVVALVALAPIAAAANETQEIRELRKEVGELRDAVRELKGQLRQLKGQPPAPVATTEQEKELEAEIRAAMPPLAPGTLAPGVGAVAAAPPVQPAVGAGIGKSSSILNPDISFNGDFTFLGTDNRQLNKANRFSFREAEVGFQAPIDPYARADAFITFDEGESPGVEEAYATFLTLPYNLQARIGKFRLSFGKNNLLHRHALSQTDRPLAEVANFGEEGLSGTGIGVSYLVPNPWDQYVLVTGEVANGLGEELEGAQGIPLERPAPGRSLDDFVYVGHAQSFFDLNANNNIEVGGSFLANEPRSGTDTRVYGVDLTYRWRPLAQQGYRQFLWRSEGYFTHQDTHAAGRSVFDTSGGYTYGEYRLGQTQWVGTRVDWTEIPGTSGKKEWGVYPYFTFSPLEFGYFRVGYEYVRSDRLNDKDSHRVWLQYNFSIGPHAAHAF